MYSVVLDTNVLVAGLRSPRGASHELLRLAEMGSFEFSISVPLLAEYEDVLGRPSSQIKVSADSVNAIIDRLCCVARKQKIHFLWRPLLADQKDDMVFETALASQARYIVTFNLRDFEPTKQFGIDAITPGKFLKML